MLDTSYMQGPPGETATPDVEVSSKKEGRNKRRETCECRRKQESRRCCCCTKERSTIWGICTFHCKSHPLTLQVHYWTNTALSHKYTQPFMTWWWAVAVGSVAVAKSVSEKKLKRSRSSKQQATTIQVGLLAEQALQMTAGTKLNELGHAHRERKILPCLI